MGRVWVISLISCLAFAATLGIATASSAQTSAAGLRLAALDGRGWIVPASSGKPSVTVFWDSICAPCLVELQSLPALASANPDVEFIVAGLEPRDAQRRTLARFGYAQLQAAGVKFAVSTPAHVQRMGNRRGILPFATAHTIPTTPCARIIGALTATNLKQELAVCRAQTGYKSR